MIVVYEANQRDSGGDQLVDEISEHKLIGRFEQRLTSARSRTFGRHHKIGFSLTYSPHHAEGVDGDVGSRYCAPPWIPFGAMTDMRPCHDQSSMLATTDWD